MARRERNRRGVGGKVIDPWWSFDLEKGAKRAAENAISTAKMISRDLKERREEMLHHMRLYAGRYDLRGGAYSAAQQPTYNITRSIVDTAQSLIAQTKPRPMFLTSDGGWELKKRAKLRARIIDGQFDIANIDELRHQWFLDGAITGIGVLAPYIDPATRKVLARRIDPLLFLVDLNDGKAGTEPRETYVVHAIDRGVLRSMYEDNADAQLLIDGAAAPQSAGFDTTMFINHDTTTDQVMVLEAVRLPSAKDAGDGRRIMAVSSGSLSYEEYDAEIQPYAFYRYAIDSHSFYGLALAEQCRAASRRLNRLGETQERASMLLSTVKFLAPREINLDERALGNGIGEVIEYDGKTGLAPQVVPWSGRHPDWSAERQEIREEVFSATGFSTLVAEGRKPQGLDSGAAQIAYDDIQSRRHVIPTQLWESAHMRLVQVFEILNDRNTGEGHDIPLPAKHRKGTREYVQDVKWSEVTKDAGKLYTRTYPISSLPNTPRGKWALVKDWIQTGFLSRTSAKQLMDFPDLEEQLGFELADSDAIMDDIDRIIDGEYDRVPEPVVSPEMALDIARLSYLQLRADRAPEELLEAVRTYMDYARELINLAQPPQQQPMPQQAAPQAVGPVAPQPMPGGALPAPAPGVMQ